MWLKLEDFVYNNNPSYEYVNSDRITRIRLTKKRIRLYTSMLSYIYVGRTKWNMKEIKKLNPEMEW